MSETKNDRRLPEPWRPRTRWLVRPLYLLSMGVVLSLLVFGSSLYEQARDREAILTVMRHQARSLAEAVAKAAINAIRANDEIVSERTGRLAGVCEHVARMWRERPQTNAELAQIARELRVDEISVYGNDGRVLGAGHERVERALDEGGTIREDHSTHRLAFDGGVVVVRDDPLEMLGTRRRVGVGRLVQDIGDETGVAYVVLQDDRGILAASREVRHLTGISSDPFLQRVVETGKESSRVHIFDDQEILESVLRLPLNGNTGGILRVGLWMGPVREVEAWGRSRLLWMSGGLAVAALVLVNFLMLRQNYDTLRGAYRQIRTYTGDVLEHMADGVVVVNTSGKIVTFNRAAEQIFDFSVEEVLGKSCRDIVAEQTPILERTLETGQGIVDTECRYRTRRGKELILSVSTSVIVDSGGAPELCIAVVKDLTGEKKIEQELQRRERLAAMGDLAAGVAHEVRNPMNAIGMTVQRLGLEFTPQNDAAEYRDLVNLVESEILRVNGIVEQFLTLARPPKLKRTSVRVDVLVRDLGHLVEAKAAEGQVTLLVAAGESKTITGDREQLSQALLNLLMNAIEATPSAGRVDLTCATRNGTDGDWIELRVRDTGSGMDEATQRRVFDPYFTTKPSGTGLGLSLVERIVSDHHGRLELESSPGAGTSFTILLPMDGRDE